MQRDIFHYLRGNFQISEKIRISFVVNWYFLPLISPSSVQVAVPAPGPVELRLALISLGYPTSHPPGQVYWQLTMTYILIRMDCTGHKASVRLILSIILPHSAPS